MAYDVEKSCETCGGDGVVDITYPPGNPVCWNCGGTGKVKVSTIATLDADLADFRNDLQAYLVDFRADLAAAIATIIQKLNQILAKLP